MKHYNYKLRTAFTSVCLVLLILGVSSCGHSGAPTKNPPAPHITNK